MRQTVFSLVFLLLVACGPSLPAVTVDGETLVGKFLVNGKVAAFLGVPFAAPPVDDFRWRAPQPVQTRLKQRDVSEFAPACMQSMRILDWYRYMAELFGGSADYYDDLEVSEDCLYLNVWTPTLDATQKLPVMVWVHGGSNKSGWSYELNYQGQQLAQRDVVVVSVAYRHGVFGFLAPEDNGDDTAVTNFAYWDLIAALEWVRDNIERFGGDRDRVTLFGESSGAQNSVMLMFAKPAQGLFQRVIGQSTPGFGPDDMGTLAADHDRARQLADLFGLESATAAELRQIPAEALLEKYELAFADHYHSPTIDDQLFTRPVWDDIQEGKFPEIPLIIGTNDDEWYDFLAPDTTWDDIAERAATLSAVDPGRLLAVVRSEQEPRRALDRLITARRFLCNSQHTAARMTDAGRNAWMYHFTRVREDAAGAQLGAYHGAEYPYVFGTHDAYMTTSETDRKLEDIMQRYWVQFAATGDPNAAGTPEWPQFSAPTYAVQELGDTVFTKPAPEPELCALFEDWLAENYPVPAAHAGD